MTVIVPKRKWRLAIPISQFGAGPNHSGTKYRKKHERARQEAGRGPMGACIFHTTRKDRESCRCGGHNKAAA